MSNALVQAENMDGRIFAPRVPMLLEAATVKHSLFSGEAGALRHKPCSSRLRPKRAAPYHARTVRPTHAREPRLRDAEDVPEMCCREWRAGDKPSRLAALNVYLCSRLRTRGFSRASFYETNKPNLGRLSTPGKRQLGAPAFPARAFRKEGVSRMAQFNSAISVTG